MNTTQIVAIVLIIAGALSLAYGQFSYTKETHQAKIGQRVHARAIDAHGNALDVEFRHAPPAGFIVGRKDQRLIARCAQPAHQSRPEIDDIPRAVGGNDDPARHGLVPIRR